jgi:hypothetical protein
MRKWPFSLSFSAVNKNDPRLEAVWLAFWQGAAMIAGFFYQTIQLWSFL